MQTGEFLGTVVQACTFPSLYKFGSLNGFWDPDVLKAEEERGNTMSLFSTPKAVYKG